MYNRIKNSILYRYNNYSYNRFIAGVPVHNISHEKLKQDGYYSQCGQDKWLIDHHFKGVNNGCFVDIGAHDGVSFSNTLKLEELGWTGVAVEPMPETYKKLKNSRKCTTVNGCISRVSGQDSFRLISGYSQMLSGLVSEYGEQHLERIKREIEEHGGSYRDIDVNCFNFNELMAMNDIVHIDYLNLDVEGGELAVLESIDFNEVYIEVIGVENNYLDARIPKLLARKGFKLEALVGDEIYINQSNK